MRTKTLILILVAIINLAKGQNQECPYKIIDLKLLNWNHKIHYNPLLSPDLQHLLIVSPPYLVLCSPDCKVIDTISNNSLTIGACKWINDTLFQFRNYKTKNTGSKAYSYNIKTKLIEEIDNINQDYIRNDISKTVSLNYRGAWEKVIDTSVYILDVIISPDKSKVLMNIYGRINVYSITKDSIVFIGKLDHHSMPVGWLANSDYFLYFVDKEIDDHTVESEYHIAKFDCKNSWQITFTKEIAEGSGSIVKDILYFTDLNKNNIYKCRLTKK